MATRLRLLALAINCLNLWSAPGSCLKSMVCAGRYLLEPLIGRELDPSQASAGALNI